MSDDLRQYLARCAYEGIEFPVVEMHTKWGHDKVEHVAYGVPGAENEPTGRKALKISIKACFLNTLRGWPNTLFPNTWKQLVDTLASTPKGTLTHATRGNIDVMFDDASEPLSGKGMRNGVYMDLEFTEDNASASVQIGDAASGTTNSTQSDPATLTSTQYTTAITTFASAGLALTSSFSAIPSLLTNLQGTPLPYLGAVRTFTAIRQGISDMLAVPAMALLSSHDARVAVYALLAAVNRYQDRYVGTTAPRTYTVPADMALVRIASILYGDASKAAILRNANQIPNELLVPRGTVLLVL